VFLSWVGKGKLKVRLSFGGRQLDVKSGLLRRKGREFLKLEYLGRVIDVDYTNRSVVVRTFMDVFNEREYTSQEIKSIKRFLKRYHLNRAEVLAVILHLGYRYSAHNTSLGNVAIADYLDCKPIRVHRASPKIRKLNEMRKQKSQATIDAK
jgi:hypothetical protein